MREREEKGITLIALVVTIIVLLILAGISISMLTGSNGILNKAVEAQESTDVASTIEQIQLELMSVAVDNSGAYTLEDVENAVLEVIGSTETLDLDAGTVKTEKGNEIDILDIVKGASDYKEPFSGTTVAEAIAYADVLSTEENTEVEDEHGNTVVVPAGFFITDDADTVPEGIVVEDATGGATDGSQFVWIPVGTIYKTGGSTVEIALDRYTFDSSGVATGHGSATIDSYYIEETKDQHEASGYGNTVAKDIEEFITSAKSNGGYYIGRYEARTSTARSGSGDVLTQLTEVGTEYVYNYVTQLEAAELCENMYDSENFTSDLVNSYAWDTATLFLQTFGDNPTYSRQTSLNKSLATQGTNSDSYSGDVDVQCNVYDMASNAQEWTTETGCFPNKQCLNRGGKYALSAPLRLPPYPALRG